MNPSLYLLISGFGTPHWEHKIEILKNNLQKLTTFSWSQLKVVICQYSDKTMYKIPQELVDSYKLDIVYESGVVGEFIIRYASEEKIKDFDYIMIMLDDIELQNIDVSRMIKYYNDFQFDILSPSLSHDSKFQYKYMLVEPHLADIKVVNVCEYFCMFFNTANFKKYYTHLYLDNPWMWGLDLVLKKHLNLRVGLLNKMVMKHWYKNESYYYRPDINPEIGFHSFINRFNETPHDLSVQKPIEYYIFEFDTTTQF